MPLVNIIVRDIVGASLQISNVDICTIKAAKQIATNWLKDYGGVDVNLVNIDTGEQWFRKLKNGNLMAWNTLND